MILTEPEKVLEIFENLKSSLCPTQPKPKGKPVNQHLGDLECDAQANLTLDLIFNVQPLQSLSSLDQTQLPADQINIRIVEVSLAADS